MHASLKKTIAVQAAPEPDRAEMRRFRQRLLRKIDLSFFRHQIDVGKNRYPGRVMLQDLRTPTSFRASIIPFTLGEAEIEKEPDQIGEELPGATERVVIMVPPAKTEAILASLLDLPGSIAFFPIAAFFRKEEFAGSIGADQFDRFGLQLKSEFDRVAIIRKIPLSSSPKFLRSDNRSNKSRNRFARDKVSPPKSFDRKKLKTVFDCDTRPAQSAPKPTAYFGRQIVSRDKVDQRFCANC
jgi:hypothetical protein